MGSYIGTILDDDFWGGQGDDFLFGDAGNDSLDGWMGSDTIFGGAGDDLLRGGYTNPGQPAGDDYLSGDEGNDLLWGDDGDDGLSGGKGDDRLSGDEGNDFLFGNHGNDTLFGGDGDDRLIGGCGEDVFWGGTGKDVMKSMADGQRDVFVFETVSASQSGGGRDRIVGFESGTDLIDLHFIDADSGRPANQKFTFSDVGAGAHSVWTSVHGAGLLVQGDTNGDAVADFEIFLPDVSLLSAADFLL